MNERRRAVDASLKRFTVPLLRERGFKGSYPHFYRNLDDHVDLLTFQFRLDGSSFVVEISYADAERSNVTFRPETPVEKLQASATRKRYRLGSREKRGPDGEWLQLSHGPLTTDARHFSKLALRVNELLLVEGEAWWAEMRHAT